MQRTWIFCSRQMDILSSTNLVSEIESYFRKSNFRFRTHILLIYRTLTLKNFILCYSQSIGGCSTEYTRSNMRSIREVLPTSHSYISYIVQNGDVILVFCSLTFFCLKYCLHPAYKYKHKAYYGTNNVYVCVILIFFTFDAPMCFRCCQSRHSQSNFKKYWILSEL